MHKPDPAQTRPFVTTWSLTDRSEITEAKVVWARHLDIILGLLVSTHFIY